MVDVTISVIVIYHLK